MIMDDEALGVSGKLDFLSHFADLPDPRQGAKVRYPLDEVFLLTRVARS